MVRRLLRRLDPGGLTCYMFEFDDPLYLNQFAPLVELRLLWWDSRRSRFTEFPFQGVSDDVLWQTEQSSSGFRVNEPSDDLEAYMFGSLQLSGKLLYHLWTVGDEHALYWVGRSQDTTVLDVMTALCGELPMIESNEFLPLLS